jgi:hypothetical protein
MPDSPEPKTALLQSLDTAGVPATTAPMVIGDYFKKNSRVKFAAIWGEFKSRFFDKTEKPAAELTYRKYKLLHISADGPIIAELGGESKVVGPVSAALALLERQADGEVGFLQTNGYANIFYSEDQRGELCAIRIGWADGGWVIDAIAVEDPLAWNGKHEIFCPIQALMVKNNP